MKQIWWLACVALASACGPAEMNDHDSGATPGVDGSTPDRDGGTTPEPDGGGTTSPDGGGTPAGWRVIPFPSDHLDARVTGIHCTARNACVVSTDPGTDGRLLSATDSAVTGLLLDGATLDEVSRVLGDVAFGGLQRTPQGLVARLDNSGAYVSATSDFTNPSSWSAVSMGMADGDGTLALNQQEFLLGNAAGDWVFINNRGIVYQASEPPSPSTLWTRVWSPTASPPFPRDFASRYAADPTLCNSDVTSAVAPHSTQNVWGSDDLSVILTPAGAINQYGDASPGVCVSTDGGTTFYNVPFPEIGDEYGPIAVTCLDANRCFAYNGLQFDDNSTYVYYTTNASAGVGSTWTRATLPAGLAEGSNVQPRHLFFAPDGTHGWLAGARDGDPMLLRTTDGGLTWTDISSAIRGATEERLHAGFALDANAIWVGGEHGALLFHPGGGV